MTTPNDIAGQMETSSVTAGQTDHETAASDEHDNNTDVHDVQDHDDAEGDEINPNAEAARYRVQRNEARRECDEMQAERDQMQQERDEARGEATVLRQSIVDQIAIAAGLPDAGLLDFEGHNLDSLLADDGTVDTDRVRAATAEVMRKYGIIKRRLAPNPQQSAGHGGQPRGSGTEGFARAFGPSQR